MSTINSSEAAINVDIKAVVLENTQFDRRFDFNLDGNAQASVGFNLEQPDKDQSFRSTVCRVELKDVNENVILVLQTTFRAEFDLPAEGFMGSDAELSSLAMRLTYPYHRQVIATLTVQSGLPAMTIPLITEQQLETISRGSKEG